MNQDLEHLRLLSIFHYIVAGMGAFFACFPIFHLTFGLVMLFAPDALGPKPPPDMPLRVVGGLLVGIAATIILVGWSVAFCVFLAGRNLARQRRYIFCLVMAAILCLFMPFGTVLGVFTIIVLMRPSVKPLFEQQAADPFANTTPPL